MLSSMYVILTFPALEFLIRKLKKICRFSLFYAYHCIECSPYLLATYYSIFISKNYQEKEAVLLPYNNTGSKYFNISKSACGLGCFTIKSID